MKFYRLFVVLVFIACVYACGSGGALKKADKTYASGAYYKAIKQYKKAIPKASPRQKALANYKLGDCYRILNENRQAEAVYARLVRRNERVSDVYLRYAEVLIKNNKFDEAEKALAVFKRQYPNDKRIPATEATIVLARKHAATSTIKYIVENFAEANSIFNDFAPAFATGDYETLLFTSSRIGSVGDKKRHDVTGERASNIYKIERKHNEQWAKPQKDDDLSTRANEEGACVFNSSYTNLYFTKTQGVFDDLAASSIYIVHRDNNYNWDEPQLISVAADTINVGHPAISADELTLYFASDMRGGFGGHDIWKVTRASIDEPWSEPINLGNKINTSGDEKFPYVHANGSLYFASDGHAGYGGLDIFCASQSSVGNWDIQNLGMPFNSSDDDFAIIFEGNANRGYFSSNRSGGKGGDDIYRFYEDIPIIEYFAEGEIKDARTNLPLVGTVKLTGNNGSVLIRQTEKDGKYKFKLNDKTDYICIASAKNHLNQKLRISTVGIDKSQTFTDTLLLMPTDKPIEIPNIFYDFGKADLSPQSQAALDGLAETMRDNPTIVIELSAHTDSRGTDKYNNDLSQHRAQAVVDYLVREGIDEKRLVPRGYGKRYPKTADKKTAAQYSFLQPGRRLDDKYINTLKDDAQKEICYQLNRRTEMTVIEN